MNKKPEWFKGVFPALVTPFSAPQRGGTEYLGGGTVDEAAYRALIRSVLPHVNGVVPVGTTGEFAYMSDEEKRRAIAIAIDEVGGQMPVIAGTGCPSTRETVAMTQYAKDAGAQAALVVAPYYLKPTYNEIYEHYEAVNRVGIPIILYNLPQCAGTHFEWWGAEGMAQLDNVVGIKDTSGDMPFFMTLLEKLKGRIGIFCGHDEIVAAALAAGADGVILASANVIPDYWQQIYQAVQAGDIAQAQTVQAQVQTLARVITRQGSVQAVKECLGMMGLDVGEARLPMMPGDAFRREDREECRIQLEKLGKIRPGTVEYHLAGKETMTQLPATPQTPRHITGWALKVGEGFAGPPFFELAHIDLLLGSRHGPVDKALAQALGVAHPGHEVRLIQEKPRTLLVPTVTIRSDKQAEHIYTYAARGVLRAIEASIADGFLPKEGLDDLVMIANVFVHPAAANRMRIEMNNFKAMRAAIRKAIEGRPTLEELLAERQAARHPFRYAP